MTPRGLLNNRLPRNACGLPFGAERAARWPSWGRWAAAIACCKWLSGN